MRILYIFLLILPTLFAKTQTPDTLYSPISAVVFLDSFVVTATRQGFNVQDFITLVEEDESFYTAFKNLRFKSVDFKNNMTFKNKKGKVTASYNSLAQQVSDGKCRTMSLDKEVITGNFYKNKKKKKHRYYTAKMYDQIFYTKGKKCGVPFAKAPTNLSGMDKHISELKKLIFSPGQKVQVPLIGSKTAIFTEDMLPYYDYTIKIKTYQNDVECYVFSAIIKPKFQNHKEGKTIIKYLETYFEKETLQVIARDYQLQYNSLAFSFDVNMKIELQRLDNQYVPRLIQYNGAWDIPAKKPEIGTFSIEFFNYQ